MLSNIFVLVVGFAAYLVVSATGPADSEKSNIQAAIRNALYPTTNEEACRGEFSLLELARAGRGAAIIDEYFKLIAANQDDNAPMLALRLIYKLELPGDEILTALSSHLSDPDPLARRSAELTLRESYHPRVMGIRDTDVTEFFQPNHDSADVNKAIMILLESEPDAAIMPIAKAYLDPEKRKDILWTAHAVADKLWEWNNGFGKPEDRAAVVEQLNKLCDRPEWWVRYYVAAMLHSHSELHDPKLIDRLQKDSDPRVKELAMKPFG